MSDRPHPSAGTGAADVSLPAHPERSPSPHAPADPEQALRDSEARLRAIWETAVDGVITIDERGRIDSVNPAAERLFGYTAAELIGRNVSMLMPAPYREAHDGYLAHYLRTGERKIIGIGREVVGLRKDGRTFAMDLAVSEFFVGERRMFTGVVHDVSERKAAEEQLKALNESLEQRVRERTAVAEELAVQLRALANELAEAEQRERRRLSTVLHDDLAQTLAICRMKLALLARTTTEPHSAAMVEDLKEALTAALQSTRLLMQDLSPPMLYDLGLAAALGSLGERLEMQHGLKVEVRAGPEPAMDDDLRAFLFQAVRELLTNVVKYAGTDRAAITLDGQPGLVALTVEDAGTGFDTKTLTWRPSEHGGYGLFNIRQRVEALGGRIEVQSRPGQGTRVYLSVPLEG